MSIVRDIAIAWLGAVLALFTYGYLVGHSPAVVRLLGNAEGYGVFPSGEIARVNDPTDAMFEFPEQRNDARRPARVNNRTLSNAQYPSCGPPIATRGPGDPLAMGVPVTTRPGAPSAAAYDPGSTWAQVSPGDPAASAVLLSDLMPSHTAPPVRSLADSYSAEFAGHASTVPVDS